MIQKSLFWSKVVEFFYDCFDGVVVGAEEFGLVNDEAVVFGVVGGDVESEGVEVLSDDAGAGEEIAEGRARRGLLGVNVLKKV